MNKEFEKALKKRIPWNKGIQRTEKTKQKISKKLIGRFAKEKNPSWNGGKEIICIVCGGKRWVKPSEIKKGHDKFCSRKCAYKYFSKYCTGKKAFHWQGGLTKRNYNLRVQPKYKLWRNSVFERDDYMCRICGDNKGHNLVAHHILSFKKYPDKRLDINNGITLCERCHKKIHKGVQECTIKNLKNLLNLSLNGKDLFQMMPKILEA